MHLKSVFDLGHGKWCDKRRVMIWMGCVGAWHRIQKCALRSYTNRHDACYNHNIVVFILFGLNLDSFYFTSLIWFFYIELDIPRIFKSTPSLFLNLEEKKRLILNTFIKCSWCVLFCFAFLCVSIALHQVHDLNLFLTYRRRKKTQNKNFNQLERVYSIFISIYLYNELLNLNQ